MRFLVRMRLFDSIIAEADIKRARKDFVQQLDVILKSGAMVAGGAFADARGGFVILDADMGEQLWELLGPKILDHFDVDAQPVLPLETLKEFLEKAPK